MGRIICSGWCIADTDLALMLNRLVMHGDRFRAPAPLCASSGSAVGRPGWRCRQSAPEKSGGHDAAVLNAEKQHHCLRKAKITIQRQIA
ncbi:hypothetical protein M8494_28010 [Serratia ureilytica]